MRTELLTILIPGSVILVSIAVLFLLRSFVFKLLTKWAKMTTSEFDDMVVKALKTPSIYWVIAIGLYLGIATSSIPDKYTFYLNKLLYIIIIVSITIAIANLVGRIFKGYVQKSNLPISTTGLTYAILKGSILLIGLLVLLGFLGVSIAPLITALGVGGLAVALALQDTLANLFAGIHILVEKSVRIGDFIKLESGQEGYVEDITWRTTRVRMLPNNIVVIPNKKLSESVVVNYYLPSKEMSLLIPISVAYGTDPEKIETIVIEEAKEAAQEIPGLLSEEEPFVRFIPGFGESSLDFTLICRVKEFTDQYLAQHELRKRILKRFQQEGIEIPYPQRSVHLKADGIEELLAFLQEKHAAKSGKADMREPHGQSQERPDQPDR